MLSEPRHMSDQDVSTVLPARLNPSDRRKAMLLAHYYLTVGLIFLED